MRRPRPTLWIFVLALGLSGPALAQLRFEDDGEHAIDAGPWGYINVQPNISQSFTSAAAHRGDGGYRLVDSSALSGSGNQGGIGIANLPNETRRWLREWVRISPTSNLGNAVVSGMAGQDVRITSPNNELQLGGTDGPNFTISSTGVRVDGGWHLVELNVEGIGTDAGTRSLWFDGTLISRLAPIDISNEFSNLLQIGEWWSDDRRWTGTLDFDDVRLTLAPPASRLVIREQSRRPGCVEIVVGLEASAAPGTFVAPAHDVFARATVDGGDLHPPSSNCLGPGTMQSLVLLQAGTVPDASFFIRTDDGGTPELVVEETDYLSGRAVFTGLGLVDGGGFDAGDGGPVDAGDPDAGDGGMREADAGDGGGPDGGQSHQYAVGCGCHSGAGGAAAWLLLPLLGFLRMRNGRSLRPVKRRA